MESQSTPALQHSEFTGDCDLKKEAEIRLGTPFYLKLYYVLPDAPNNQAYVGGPNEYQVYQQMRVAKQISDNNLAAAQMNQMNAMNWGMWGGWGGVGGFRY